MSKVRLFEKSAKFRVCLIGTNAENGGLGTLDIRV